MYAQVAPGDARLVRRAFKFLRASDKPLIILWKLLLDCRDAQAPCIQSV